MNGLTGTRRSARPVRLALAQQLGAEIDGAWWPYTASVAGELPGLIEALRPPLGEIVDISSTGPQRRRRSSFTRSLPALGRSPVGSGQTSTSDGDRRPARVRNTPCRAPHDIPSAWRHGDALRGGQAGLRLRTRHPNVRDRRLCHAGRRDRERSVGKTYARTIRCGGSVSSRCRNTNGLVRDPYQPIVVLGR